VRAASKQRGDCRQVAAERNGTGTSLESAASGRLPRGELATTVSCRHGR